MNQQFVSRVGLITVVVCLAARIVMAADQPADPRAVIPFDAAAAKRHQETSARRLKSAVEVTNGIDMKFVLIPAGEMSMGSPASEAGHLPEEQTHKARITKPYYLGKFEVTQKQWMTVMESAPWKGKPYSKEGESCAASYISWTDCQRFCEKLSNFDGNDYRLPTEAEWEFAARAGTATAYSFGENPDQLASYGWYIKNADGAGQGYPHPVGELRANPFGLHDMHGNVWEWCQDRFSADPTKAPPEIQPRQRGFDVAIRGGFFGDVPANLRSSRRSGINSLTRLHTIGFRVVVEADPGLTFRKALPRLTQISDDDLRRKLTGTTWIGKEIGGCAPSPKFARDFPTEKVTCWTEYYANGSFGGLFKTAAHNRERRADGVWGTWDVFHGMIMHTMVEANGDVFTLETPVWSRIVSIDDQKLTLELPNGTQTSHDRAPEKIDRKYLSTMNIGIRRNDPPKNVKKLIRLQENAEDESMKKRIVGVWDGRETAGLGITPATGPNARKVSYAGRTFYNDDGTFVGSSEIRNPGAKSRTTVHRGKWKVLDGDLIHIFTEGTSTVPKWTVTTNKIVSLKGDVLKYRIEGTENDSVQRRVRVR